MRVLILLTPNINDQSGDIYIPLDFYNFFLPQHAPSMTEHMEMDDDREMVAAVVSKEQEGELKQGPAAIPADFFSFPRALSYYSTVTQFDDLLPGYGQYGCK